MLALEVWQPNRIIELLELHWGDDDVQAKIDWLLKAVINGGCVCWITNTVKRAQCIFDALLKSAPSCVDLELLHSQFPLDERQQREAELARKYGPVKRSRLPIVPCAVLSLEHKCWSRVSTSILMLWYLISHRLICSYSAQVDCIVMTVIVPPSKSAPFVRKL